MNTKKLSTIITASTFYLFYAAPAFAQQGVDPCTSSADNIFSKNLCALGSTPDSIAKSIRNVVIAILVIAVLIALFYLIWGAIKWIISGGDKAAVESARNTIVAALVGLIVAFLAYFIISLVLGIFGLSLTNLAIPNIIP